jgi:hypothetical protein
MEFEKPPVAAPLTAELLLAFASTVIPRPESHNTHDHILRSNGFLSHLTTFYEIRRLITVFTRSATAPYPQPD